MAIQGSAEVLTTQIPRSSELRPDIERIVSSSRSLRSLTADVLGLVHSADSHPAEISLEKLLAQVASLLDYKLKNRGLTLTSEIPHSLPKLPPDCAHLQLGLLDLMLWVMEQTAPEGRISLKAGRSGGNLELCLHFGPRASGMSTASLAVHAHVLARDHVDLRTREKDADMELRLVFRGRERARA